MTAPAVLAGRPPLAPSRRVAAYENWQPPVVGISLLVLVGVGNLLVADTTGRGDILLPVGPVQNGQTLGQAAQQLLGRPDLIPVHRRVVLDQTQTRRRTVTTHLLATRPCSAEDAAALTYRDPRAVLRVLPTSRAVAALPERARARTLLGLQALATGRTAYLIDGTLSPTPPA
ncbi:hypothetical protein [Streptomyces sp. NPDC056132]|uniref:hypothetical protein n=1 Tax=Streptomyces sp. NPDC056132 TaxID=3345722 RepID=UPI0035E1E715